MTTGPRKPGRPALHGERLVVRSLGLPAHVWRALDAEAKARRVSTRALIRERLVAGAVRGAKGGSGA